MKAQAKFLLLLICRVVHTFRTSSLSVFRLERDVFAAESLTLFSSSSPSDNSDPVAEEVTGVTLKIAFDSQGGVADLSSEKSERFTCGESLDMVHRLRRVSDAVLVGRSTVEIDDCTLTVRRVPLQQNQAQPVRVVIYPKLDSKLEQFQIFRDGLATIIVHTIDANESKHEDDEKENCDITYVKSTDKANPNLTFLGLKPINDHGKQRLSTRQICEVLAKEFDIHHIMVEGGANTALQFLKDVTVDRAILVYAPISFKNPLLSNISSTILGEAGLEQIGSYKLGVDSVKCYSRREKQWPSIDLSSWP